LLGACSTGEAANWRFVSDTFCKGCILEFESRPERAKVPAFSVVLTYELPGEEMRIGSGKGNMPRHLPGRGQIQLCANETGEVSIAW
jgi:hypothetical protein